jgi:PKHD-type hydroxylase
MSGWSFYNCNYEPYAYWDGAFSPPECEAIIKMGLDKGIKPGVAVGDTTEGIRRSSVSWISVSEESDWIYKRCSEISIDLNNKFFGFDLFGMMEDFQFTQYKAPGERYGKHLDTIRGGLPRKLSLVLQLSDPKDYEGGELVLHLSEVPTVIPRKQGYIAIFPSFILHEVTPVTQGTRHSLVSWIAGKPFV